MINYGFTKEMDIPYETVIEQVREALKKEGFGILTEIDVREKMKEKLGVDMNKVHYPGCLQSSECIQSDPCRGKHRTHASLQRDCV